MRFKCNDYSDIDYWVKSQNQSSKSKENPNSQIQKINISQTNRTNNIFVLGFVFGIFLGFGSI